MRLLALVPMALVALAGAGCGEESASGEGASVPTKAASGGETGGASGASASRSGGTRVRAVGSDYGRVVANRRGEAFYLFGRESNSRSQCYGSCARAWPPVLTKGSPVALRGAKQRLLGTTRRKNGKLQATYAGHPLYYYVHDSPGNILCHDVVEFGGRWLVVKPSGRPAA